MVLDVLSGLVLIAVDAVTGDWIELERDYCNVTLHPDGKVSVTPEDSVKVNAPPRVPARRPCCRICRTGKACGNSCIARNKTCRKGRGCACNGESPQGLECTLTTTDKESTR